MQQRGECITNIRQADNEHDSLQNFSTGAARRVVSLYRLLPAHSVRSVFFFCLLFSHVSANNLH